MSSILKISEAAVIAIHAMQYLARAQNKKNPATVIDIARQLNISEAHLSKVFQRLTKLGLVSSKRGPAGGFKLKKAADSISLLEIYEAIDGPLRSNSCIFEHGHCLQKECLLSGLLDELYQKTQQFLVTRCLAVE